MYVTPTLETVRKENKTREGSGREDESEEIEGR